ncbi:hypothetical protein [Mucilaginibacter myungsuensis]|uniref:Uncharacterized protein n=1 Tax=Mucilaginibacter myungsuensis TaxID=649104 RepID=A0A929PWF8_9SPHI|nr:hypothetical protein [Mucilaginibacter myungsuensis]MBE9662089.1 hypothetical protein [Mucilaginibacter myungsuensis]MDN3599477.1 hypothetical protein [Mucilaginibacter myungsuensis]
MIPHKPLIEIQEFPKFWNIALLALFVLLLFLLPGIDSGAFLTQSVPAAGGFIVVWAWVYFTYLKLTISAEGITLRSSPIGIVSCEIKKEAIAKIEVRPLDAWKDFGGLGWRLNAENVSGYIFGGSIGLLITKKSGDQVMISTTLKPEELSAAIAELALDH